jgi:carboxypeptidase C (cathepsin A)
MKLQISIAAALIFAFSAAGTWAAPAPPAPTEATLKAACATQAAAEETASTTHHVATIRGARVTYEATAGTLTIRNAAGKPTASMFYVAYTLEPRRPSRPVTLLYNGGPGSSSVWLHLASFGPRRVELDAPDLSRNAPHRLVDNDNSLLPETDLVFLDAINTGYSRPLEDAKPEDFLTADSDIDAFARGVERYLTLQNRWNAPKYLFGESYGTSRSAGLVDRLQKDGLQMSGIIQLGSILELTKALASTERGYLANIPTYAVTAAYHGAVAKPADMDAFVSEVIGWTEGPYSQALTMGHDLPEATKTVLARQMSAYTGLSVPYLVQNHLRISPDMFRSELLREKGRLIGELDTRFVMDASSGDRAAAYDPSYFGVSRAILSTAHDYLRDELGFRTDLEYRRAYSGSSLSGFDFRRTNGSGLANYGPDLAEAMMNNPHLVVLAMNGLYDLSTPFYGARYDYRQLMIPASLTANIRIREYAAGHMAYTDPGVLHQMLSDIDEIYRSGQVK